MALFRKLQQLRLDIKRIAFTLRHSITRRLLYIVFSIYLVVTITVTVFHMDFEYEASKHQTINALKNVQMMIYNSLGQAIWEFNNTQIDSILSGVFKNEYVAGIKLEIPENTLMPDLTNKQMGYITDNDGNIIYVDPNSKQSNIVTSSFLRLFPNAFTIEHRDALNRKIVIGKMWLYSSNMIVFNQVKYSYVLLIVNAAIKTISLWIFFLWAGYYFISKPLATLTDAIKQLASGKWHTELSLNTRNSKNKTEINTLFESFNDMTRKLQSTRDQLILTYRRLDEIFDTMPSALFSVNNKNVIQGWNKNIVQLTGISVNAALGQNLVTIFPAFKQYANLVEAALKEGSRQEVQHVHIAIDPNNTSTLYHIIAYPIKSIHPLEVVVRIDDVTEQVMNEASLAQVEKLASVGASIAGVAHEINNPLASIMQSTQNISRRLDPELESNQQLATQLELDLHKQYKYLQQREILKFLQDILAAGERASNIVKNMLRFTRRSTAEMVKCNLHDLIKDSLQLCANDMSILQQTDPKTIIYDLKLDKAHLQIECIPQELQQVILNIVRNSVQAMRTDQPDKRISISVDHVAENKIQLKISDNGHGIPPEIIDKIFQPFFTTKPAGVGTGLGLSVCRNIIMQKHHGDLNVESVVGKGTTFYITLPMHQHT